jgi:hypothetical protein
MISAALRCLALDVLFNCPNSECHHASPTINEDQVKRITASYLIDMSFPAAI